jgi:hypothetical protein
MYPVYRIQYNFLYIAYRIRLNFNPYVRKDERDLSNTKLQLRLKPHEAERFYKLWDLVIERNRLAEKSDVIRELIGLSEPKLLTKKEIEYFRTGEEL